MLFAVGIVMMVLAAAAIVGLLGARGGKLPAHGTRASLALCALVLAFLAGGGGCVFASLLMSAARGLP